MIKIRDVVHRRLIMLMIVQGWIALEVLRQYLTIVNKNVLQDS